MKCKLMKGNIAPLFSCKKPLFEIEATGWCSGNFPDLHSGGAGFEFWPEH
jgi:hypothetical protein